MKIEATRQDRINRKPTHPGVVFREDVLNPLNITVTDAAVMLGVSRKTLSEVINEKASLSPEMAVKWALATNTTPESWYEMQVELDLWDAKNKDYHVEEFKMSA